MTVLKHINIKLGEELLEATLDESDLSLVTFENQTPGDGSVSDASIQSSTSLWFETKTVSPTASTSRAPFRPQGSDVTSVAINDADTDAETGIKIDVRFGDDGGPHQLIHRGLW